MVNITDKFLDFILEKTENLKQEQLHHQAKRCVLDYLGVILAGKKLLGNKGERLIVQFPDIDHGAPVIGYSVCKSPETAAFLNGFISHVAELDDGVNSGIVHPGTPILSAMFGIAQSKRISGVDFLKGIIIGYETAIRLANAIQPAHKKKGYHATGTCGAAGASVAIAIMLNAPRDILKNAFTAALISAGGSLKALENESELKPYNVGNAAKSGLVAYLTAEAGFKGPDDVLGGTIGFLNMKAGTYNLRNLIPSSSSYAINSIYIKPYAACRYCHPSIEAALKTSATHKLSYADIKSIHVSTYDLAVRNHDHKQVNNMSSAKMSIPFSVATAIKHGKAGIIAFMDDCVLDSDIQELTQKVTVTSNPCYSESFPEKSIAELKVILHNGKHFTEFVEYPKGEPENPLSDAELEDKFKELSTFAGLTQTEINEIIKIVWSIEIDIEQLYAHF